MSTRIVSLFAAAALSLAGCASTSTEQPALEGTPVPLTPEPDLSLPAGHQWSAFFDGAKCVLAPAFGDGVREDEFQAFADAFQEHFFGGDSCLLSVDANALDKAAERRAVLGGTPAAHALSMMATKEGADFAVHFQLDMRTEPYKSQTRRDIGAIIRATATCKMSGTPAKGTKELTGTIRHDQETTSSKVDDYRLQHAAIVGKLLAKKMLLTCADANVTVQKNVVHVTFQRFSQVDKQWIVETLMGGAIPGIGSRDFEETSTDDSDAFTLEIRTTMTPGELKVELDAVMVEEGFRVRSKAQSGAGTGNAVQIIKG